ncbi:MAG TPA: serine/threonine-protein kinase [Rhodanobacteraceae bacterium]|nr:serine/threonine-protein kinase [Rhodanobacteraceae bacterium]
MDRSRLHELFAQLLEIEPVHREPWLRAACGDDHAMRDRLERLVRADAKARDFMEAPPGLLAESLVETLESDPDRPLAFGPYRVVRSIGIGGMGEVWLAERSDGEFEQRVAIKQIAYPTPGLLQRFRQERQILARLEHPNIARLFDGGVDGRGVPYLVMEYIEGAPIDVYVRRASLDIRARLRLFLEICAAVQYAHQNLVIHRDIKPSNILVCEDGVPKLLDFGVAKVLATTDEAQPTETLARMLTPDYAAPEQFSGGAITTATDVFALGVVLYELLAGVRPARPRPGDGADPLAPSAALARTEKAAAGRAVRGDLDRIALKALAFDPARRYATAHALAADIRCHLEGRPIAARGDGALYRLQKFALRNRLALSAALGVILVSLAAAAVSLHEAGLARGEAQRAQAVRRFLTDTFAEISPDENGGQPVTAHQLLDKGAQQMQDSVRYQPALQADLGTLLGSLYRNIGDVERADELLHHAVETSTGAGVPAEIRARSLIELGYLEVDKHAFVPAYDHASLALRLAESAGAAGTREASDARHMMNGLLVWRGDANLAEQPLRETLAADQARYGEVSEFTADDWQTLGIALDELSRYRESADAFEHSVAAWRAWHGDRHGALGRALNDYGLMLLHSGDLVGAERRLREASDIADALYGPDTEGARSVRSNLLRVLEQQGKLAEALPQRLRLVQIARQRSRADRPDVLAYALNVAAMDRRDLGELEEAEAGFRETLALWKEIKGTDDAYEAANPLMNLGICLALEGRYPDAEASLRAALAIQEQHDAPTSQWPNLTRAHLGNVLRLRHRAVEGRRELEAALNALQRSGNETNPSFALMDAQLSEAQLDTADAALAEATATAALAAARKALPKANVRLGAPLFALGRAKLARGRAEEAEPLLREALAVRSPPHPPGDPRVVEVEVALAVALAALDRRDEAAALAAQVAPELTASQSPYAADLRARLAGAH